MNVAVASCARMCLLRLRAGDVHHDLALARAHDDDLRRLHARVAFAVDLSGRDVKEVAGSRLEYRLASRAALEARPAGEDVDRRLVVAVVMPSRQGQRLVQRDARPHPVGADRLLADHARRLPGLPSSLTRLT